MELRIYLAILRRYFRVVVATALATLVVAGIGTAMLPRTYEATTTVRVATADDSTDRASYDSVMYAGRLTSTYSKIAASGSVLDELAARLGIAGPPKVKVEVPANTELMQITVEMGDPALAALAADTLADILIARAGVMAVEGARTARAAVGERLAQLGAELEQARGVEQVAGSARPAGDVQPTGGARPAGDVQQAGDLQSVGGVQPVGGAQAPESAPSSRRALELQQDRYARLLDQYDRLRSAEATRASTVTVVERASVPSAPSRPRASLNIGIAALLGLVGGVGLAFLYAHLDTRLHTIGRVEAATGLPILGVVPAAAKGRPNGVFGSDSPQSEALRQIRTRILAREHGVPRTLLVTSAEPGEGKSTIVANLASVLAEVGRRVVVVDADLRRPSLHGIFGLSNLTGLGTVLEDRATWDQVMQETGRPNVWAITSGSSTSNPAELLGEPRLAALVEHLAKWFDVVVLDAPSLLAVADAAELAGVVSGVVLVVGRGRTGEGAVRAACAELTDVRARPIGVIVNRAEPVGAYRYYQQALAHSSAATARGVRQGEVRGHHAGGHNPGRHHALP